MIPKVWRLSYLGYMAILILGMVIGAQWYRLYLFPFPQLHNWVNSYEENVPLSTRPVITKYAPQVPVFLDKLYFDSIGDKRLDGLFLVQIPRHYSEKIEINARRPVTIYRFISDDNVNTQFDSWASSDIPIHVQGKTTKHTRVVKKNFPAGTITLSPGGPVASSPILIEVPSQTEAPPLEFEVLDLEMYTNASVDLAPQLLDLQLQGSDDRLGVRDLRHRPLGLGGRLQGLCRRLIRPCLGRRQSGAQGFDVDRASMSDGRAPIITPSES